MTDLYRDERKERGERKERDERVRAEVVALCRQPLPPVGSGHTDRRWLSLFRWARHHPVSVARLAEAHHDAVQILAEAGAAAPGPEEIYGVWASESATPVRYDPTTGLLHGLKPFCSGLGLVDRALVTALDAGNRRWLCDVAVVAQLDAGGAVTMEVDRSSWSTIALADTATGPVRFSDHPVQRVVGCAGFYLDRPGFWHGAIGPAACWAGAAAGLVDRAEAVLGDGSPFQASALGALRAETYLLSALLSTAGSEADRTSDDRDGARYRALCLRHLVERSTVRVVDELSRAFGPRPFVTDAALTQRLADVHLYPRQHHGHDDLAELGREPLP